MNKATMTKVLTKVAESSKKQSLGFNRLMALPQKTRKSFNLALILDGVEVSEVLNHQKEFLGSLTGNEFKNWLSVN